MTAPDTDSRPTSPRPPRRWRRRVAIGLTALLVIVVTLVGLLQLPPVATFAVGNGLDVGHVTGNFLRGLTLQDVRLRQDGRELARIERLTVGYHLPRLRPPTTRLDSLT